jgi:hypothetical protein
MPQKLIPRVVEQESAVHGNAHGKDRDSLAAEDHANPQHRAGNSARNRRHTNASAIGMATATAMSKIVSGAPVRLTLNSTANDRVGFRNQKVLTNRGDPAL